MMNEAIQYARLGVEPDHYGGTMAYGNGYLGNSYQPASYGAGCDYDPYHSVPGLGLDERIRRYHPPNYLYRNLI